QDIEIVAEIAATRHGANSLVVTDFDGDGDPDLFWGDYFESGLLYIENTGSCGQPNLRSRPVPFPPDDPLRTSG
ncbi:MAG: FG-GAP repeat protein, partial [Gemmatimonadota bacterium]